VSGLLLDTNIISELVKPRPEPNVTAWIEGIDESLLYLSVLTLGEIRRGIAALTQSRRRAALEAWLDKDQKANNTAVSFDFSPQPDQLSDHPHSYPHNSSHFSRFLVCSTFAASSRVA
jgi:hypothetical protein